MNATFRGCNSCKHDMYMGFGLIVGLVQYVVLFVVEFN